MFVLFQHIYVKLSCLKFPEVEEHRCDTDQIQSLSTSTRSRLHESCIERRILLVSDFMSAKHVHQFRNSSQPIQRLFDRWDLTSDPCHSYIHRMYSPGGRPHKAPKLVLVLCLGLCCLATVQLGFAQNATK